MNLVDFAIICAVLALAGRGLRAGLFRQVGSISGFAAGLLLGALIAPWLARANEEANVRALVAILVVFGLAMALSGLGEWLGQMVARGLHRIRLGLADEIGGALFGMVAGLLMIWLTSSMFLRLPAPQFQALLQRSNVLRFLDQKLPPAPDVVARISRLLAPNGFPQVFAGLEPAPAPKVVGPDAAAVNAATMAGRAATVEIQGDGCGGSVEGTGFVAAPGLVATNAHVVAGITHPLVYDAAGEHAATVVSFDPDLDFAVLRVSGLSAVPLKLSSATVDRGAVGAVLGYPNDGPFTVSPAAVLERQTALGRNIYDQGLVKRDIYTLQAVVRPGNSGGPLVAPNGTVMGVVFAMSLADGDVGYALTSAEVLPELNAVTASSGAVSTGACAAE